MQRSRQKNSSNERTSCTTEPGTATGSCTSCRLEAEVSSERPSLAPASEGRRRGFSRAELPPAQEEICRVKVVLGSAPWRLTRARSSRTLNASEAPPNKLLKLTAAPRRYLHRRSSPPVQI